MTIGKTYRMTWAILGCTRTAHFRPESVSKSGAVRGQYTDADGKTYKRFFVKPAQFAEWTVVP